MRLLLLLFLLPLAALAQPALPVPRNLQATYAKGTRSASGQPGPGYWQNTADYNLTISFDPAYLTEYLRVVDGGEVVQLDLVDGQKSAVFRNGEDYLYLVVPLV